MDDMQQHYEKKISCLCQQLQECHKQSCCIQEELDRARGKLSTCIREQDDLRRALGTKHDTICCLENQLEETKQELREREKSSQRITDCLQEKVCCFQEQAQQREAALLMCRNEVKSHISTMEEVKKNFNCEISQRDSTIGHLRDDIRRVYDDLRCKSEDFSGLEREMCELKSRLNQAMMQLQEAESKANVLAEKNQQMECQINKDRQAACMNNEELEKRLSLANKDLCCCQNDIRKLKRLIEEKEEDIAGIECEKNNIQRELCAEKSENENLQSQIMTLGNDNKEICRLLQQKVKCIKDLEEALCIKDDELNQCRCCVEELKTKIRDLKTGTGDNSDDALTQCQAELLKCRNRVKALEEEVADLKDKLSYAVKEMECLAKENQRLNCELEEARRELCEKCALIDDLERTIKHAEQDMEGRMRRVDDQLQRYEREIKDKTRMIVECEEKCCRLTTCLSDKKMELDQSDQKLARACCEIQTQNSQIQDLEEARDCLQTQLKDQRAEVLSSQQEMKNLRDQAQCLSCELADAKQALAVYSRDLDKCRKNTDEYRICCQEKETELARVIEDRNCQVNKVTHLQCRLETETCQLTQQMSDLKCRLEKEVEQLRTCQLEMEETNSTLMQKCSASQRQLASMEKMYYQKVDELTRENATLANKLGDTDDQLTAAKNCITLKDSELMRLKLRLCSQDKCNNSYKMRSDSHPSVCEPGCMKRGASSGPGCRGNKKCCDDFKDIKERKEMSKYNDHDLTCGGKC